MTQLITTKSRDMHKAVRGFFDPLDDSVLSSSPVTGDEIVEVRATFFSDTCGRAGK